MRSPAGRLLLVAPIWLVLAGKALAGLSGVDMGAAPMDVLFAGMLTAIAGYAVLVWRLTMNEHHAQKDELY